MRLIECNINGFGKFRNFSIKLDKGLNVICSPNGTGKTTLSFFISSMLYGLGDSRKQSLDENERKKYTPWDCGSFGGSLTVFAKGRTYRIERSFGARPSQDKCTVYDTLSGEPLNISCEFGEWALGIDKDGFERTAFLSERGITEKTENASINSRLSEQSYAEGDAGQLNAALERLEARSKFYLKRGGGGAIAEASSELYEVECRISELISLRQKSESLSEETEQKRKELQRLESSLKDASVLRKDLRQRAKSMAADSSTEARTDRRRKSLHFILFGLILCLSSVIFSFLLSPLFLVLLAPATLLLYVGFFSRTKKAPLIPNGVTQSREELNALFTNEEQIDGKITELTSNASELKLEIALNERKLEDIEKQCDNIDLLSAKRNELKERLDSYNKSLNVLQKTKELLIKAHSGMSSRYLENTRALFNRYATLLGLKAEQLNLDKGFSVQKSEDGATRSHESFSRGTRDLHSLVARLALNDSLYEGELPFLMLDDPFCLFDDERFSAASSLLYKLAGNRQIIYMTCSEKRRI